MSTDLQTQIRNLAQEVERSHDPVTVEEIRLRIGARDDTEPLVGPAHRVGALPIPRGPWPAVIAAVVVILLVGALALMLPSAETPPPADSLPPPLDGEQILYTTSAVPGGFVLQDMRTIAGSYLLFLRQVEGNWIPTDGGFAIHGIEGRPFGMPQDPDGYIDGILEAVPGSREVEVAGRRAVVFETEFSQSDLTTSLIWVLGLDDQGGPFEVAAVGMGRDEVLAVAGGVHRAAVEDFRALESEITWDVRIGAPHNGFVYSPPARVSGLADQVDVALGVDLLYSRLAGAGGEATVVTTEDGEIVDTFGEAIRSTSGALYLHVPQDDLDAVLRAYPGIAELSPRQREARIDEYLEQIRGPVLSEDPYVIQAMSGPQPLFDTSALGVELPVVAATSDDILPQSMFEWPSSEQPAATEDRPVIVLGTVGQPNSNAAAVTILVWFTKTGTICSGTASDGGIGSGCGFEVLSRFGHAGGSYEETDDGVVSGEVSYVVPLETSVVQVVTPSGTFWQRPSGGYGVVPFGDTVGRPTSIVAYDADGDEIGDWSVASD